MRTHWRRLVMATTMVAVVTGRWAASEARAVPAAEKVDIAETMAEKAFKAFTAGDYPRAAELFFNAWRTDPKPLYLWSLARCEHLAGRRDKALEYYKKFLEAPGALQEKVGPAREYVEAIERQNAGSRATQAERAERDGDGRLAASLYLDAYKAAPKRVAWLFKAAVAAQTVGDFPVAEAHLRAYLQAAPAGAADRAAAEARLESIARKRSPATGAKPGSAAPRPGNQSADGIRPVVEPASRAAAWGAIGGGALAAAGGVWWYAAVAEEQRALEAEFDKRKGGKIVGLSSDEARMRASSLNRKVAASLGLAGAGLLAAGIGGYEVAQTEVAAETAIADNAEVTVTAADTGADATLDSADVAADASPDAAATVADGSPGSAGRRQDCAIQWLWRRRASQRGRGGRWHSCVRLGLCRCRPHQTGKYATKRVLVAHGRQAADRMAEKLRRPRQRRVPGRRGAARRQRPDADLRCRRVSRLAGRRQNRRLAIVLRRLWHAGVGKATGRPGR